MPVLSRIVLPGGGVDRGARVSGRRTLGGQRSDDPFAADAATLVGLDAWSSLRTGPDSAVTGVSDVSGNGYDFTTPGASRPTYVTDGPAGVPYFLFSGVGGDHLLSAPIAKAVDCTAYEWFAVFADATPSARYFAEFGAGGGGTGGPNGSFSILVNNTNAGSLSHFVKTNVPGANLVRRSNAGTEDLTTFKVVSGAWDGAQAGAAEMGPLNSMGVDLASAVVGTADGTTTLSAQQLALNAQVSGANFGNARLCAFYLVGRGLTSDERAARRLWLSERFKLPFASELAARQMIRLLWGAPLQSNGQGQYAAYANIERWDGPHVAPLIRAYKDFYFSGTWYTSAWGALTESPGLSWEGPDLVCAVELVRTHGLAAEVIMCAQGNTSLAVDHNPSTGTTYARLRDTTWPTAIGTHPAAPASPITVNVQWHGESDSASGAQAAAYGTNLNAHAAALRTDLGVADLRDVVVRLHVNSRLGAANATTVGQVRAAQAAFVAARPTRAVLVDIDDLPLQGDAVHLTEAAGIEAAKRVAAAASTVAGYA